jgi:formate hydrogenlyase subunit 4
VTSLGLADTLVHGGLLLVLPLFMQGVINKVKAAFAGRTGGPVLQPFFDVVKLLRKGATYSTTTTWVFRAGPIVALATALCAGLLVPLHASRAPFAFEGDVVAFAGLLGLGRFLTMSAALDTGSAFEGMGASREGAFSALTEPALYLVLAILCLPAGSASFSEAWSALPRGGWLLAHPELLVAALVLLAVLLAENSRIPVDDPTTHLELTMVHEVMVLDHGGPDFGLVLYGSAVKLLVLSSVLVHLLVPSPFRGGLPGALLFVAGALGVAVLIGFIESVLARLRLNRVPQLLIGAGVLAAVGLLVALVGRTP